MTELTPYEMQCSLNAMGYDWSYLDTLQNSMIEHLYKSEYLGEED